MGEKEFRSLKLIEARIALLRACKVYPDMRKWVGEEVKRLEESRKLLLEGQMYFAFAT